MKISTWKWALQTFSLWDSDVVSKLRSFGAALPVPTRFTHPLSLKSVVHCWFYLQYELLAFCNVVACLNESSDIRLLVLYRESNGITCILYTVLISKWQLQYQTISWSVLSIWSRGQLNGIYTMLLSKWELKYHYQFRIVHEVWGTREWHIYTVLGDKGMIYKQY